MPQAWRIALWRLAVGLAGATLLGLYFGSALAGCAIGLAGFLGWHLFQVFRLEWMLRNRKRIRVPDGSGIWPRVLAAVRYQQERVRRHKKRHRQVMREVRESTNALPDGGIMLNSSNEIISFNKAARALFALRKRRDRGQRIDNLVRHPEFATYLARGEFKEPVIIPSSVSEDTWLRIQLVPYGDGQRMLLARDVTERTRLNRMRRDFVANASHELRSPLTVICGYLDAMSAEIGDGDEWAKPVREMRRQAERMTGIMDDLLTLSRLESGSPEAPKDEIDMGLLIRDVARDQERQFGRAPVRIELGTGARLLGDKTEIHSVVANLLSNALRHTPSSGEVTVGWEERDRGATLWVRDTGEGIAANDIPRLTERFFRAHRGRSRENGSVGLGLAIVNHALHRHDGSLSIESELGQGSEFRCAFPAERVVGPGAQADVVTLSP